MRSRAHVRRHARRDRRGRQRPIDRTDRDAGARREDPVTPGAPADVHARREHHASGPARPEGAHRGREGHAGHRPDVSPEPGRSGDALPGSGSGRGQGRHHGLTRDLRTPFTTAPHAGSNVKTTRKRTRSHHMRALLAAILVLVLGGAIAVGAYEAGLAQGAVQVVAPASGAAPAVAYYG